MLRSNSNCSKEKGFEAKQEGVDGKYSTSSSSRSQWSGFRNPRIVRVSRSFGGKDRHSKVCTIRGLRDRRIRLSVPTAIQLYDLQDKLKLGQPSKVIDWLLDVTKLDIDKLPPLQIPTGFSPFHQQMLFPPQYDHHHHHHYSTTYNNTSSSSNSQFCNSLPPSPFALGVKDNSSTSTTTMEKLKLWDMDLAAMRSATTTSSILQEKAPSSAATTTNKGKWIEDDQYNMMNNCNAYNSDHHHHQPDTSCLSLSQFVGNNNNNNNGVVFPSQVEAAAQTSTSNNSALFFTPYASYITNPFESHFHFLSSNSSQYPNLISNNNNNNNPSFMPNSALHPFATSQNFKPFPNSAPNFNLKNLLHADNDSAGSGKDGAAGNS